MLPSVIAQEIQEGLKQYLVAGFEPSNPTFNGIVGEALAGPGVLHKGPFLSLGLPFRRGSERLDLFKGFETQNPPWVHQEAAWRRLRSGGEAASTLVATGTGSGKTECFMYPLLDHCLREHEAGRAKGIKALIIYPMNALATDQAKRFAECIHANDALRQRVRVGLYVGEGEGGSGGEDAMTAEQVITAKDAMRRNPPDILLTNYKMLDYLLIRPKDRQLWRHNGPATLRYLVVDELHTFDGAQGTDLALLVRRIKARLKTPQKTLVCIGTSATLGDADQTTDLRQYAEQIFGEPFDERAVITENRKSLGDFLAGTLIEHQLSASDGLEKALNLRSYDAIEQAIAGWHRLFFPDDEPAHPTESAWRGTLGAKLKGQLQFNNLLRLLNQQLRSVEQLTQELPRFLPGPAKHHARAVLDALLGLIAWARDPDDPRLPLVQLRMQLWLREQRRVVLRLTRKREDLSLLPADDLRPEQGKIYLPLMQCSECLTSAWLGRLPSGVQYLDTDLGTIYDAFFSRREDVAFLYPRDDVKGTWLRGETRYACGVCAHVQGTDERCGSCGADNLVPVFRPLTVKEVKRKGQVRLESEHICPTCGAEDSLRLFGARATSLASVAIQHLWGSTANDHRKLIAFSDSVQDSAHRAGFFAARTYANNVRGAIVRALEADERPIVPWREFVADLPGFWRDEKRNPQAMAPDRFVVEFIGPNMTWVEHYDTLRSSGEVTDWLLDAVAKRLQWEVISEFGYLSKRNRSVETVGAAALGIEPERVQAALPRMEVRLREELGLRELNSDVVTSFAWGFLIHLKNRGAIEHEFLKAYLEQDGSTFVFRRVPFMPPFGRHSTRPTFLSLAPKHPSFDTLEKKGRATWYQHWLKRTLFATGLAPEGVDRDIYRVACEELVRTGVLLALDVRNGPVIGLNPAALFLERKVARLSPDGRSAEIIVPATLAPIVEGLPCIDTAVAGTYRLQAGDRHWLADLYREGEIRRVIAAEHTGLLGREAREALEDRFKAKNPRPWYENLLSATPTLEMGVDIGSLSSVLLCSIPPSQANYLQRIGRAGRRDGNALTFAIAAGRPHDLFFYARPEEMMTGQVQPPGVFLNASAVLFRQLTAFCLDSWVATGIDNTALPVTLGPALDAIEKYDTARFPYNFLAFVKANGAALFDGFCQLLDSTLLERTRDALGVFLFGGDESDSLQLRLVKRLQAVAEERKALASRARSLKTEIDQLKKGPQDEATEAQIEEARRERDAILDMNKGTNGKDLLNFMTDEGLIPNYAFPEEGVTLRSVLWRRRVTPVAGESPYQNWVEEYERAAAAALTELAPNNTFFAGGRKVKIDQIDLSLSPIETWRLCPTCSHAESLTQGDASVQCERCGDPQWADVGQKRNLVRLRQVLANTEDSRSKIDDGSDDRGYTFYNRQLLPDFTKTDVQIAYRISGDALSFGFEFIRRVTFRDLNFGHFTPSGEKSQVGGRESVRQGFRVCRHCGKVQDSGRSSAEQNEVEQEHAYSCPVKDRADESAIVDCLYLYREFASEALRLLLPVARTEVDPRIVPSLTAALRLGLKLQFGGKVDHLDTVTYDEPERGTNTIRRYLMLYDTVPGGTGYLHELLRDDGRLFFTVLRRARDHMATCTCNTDVALDGCYRCLYAYRLRSGIQQTSRSAAVSLLSEILDAEDRLEQVATISDILINPNFESALEARFVEALKRRAATDPSVRLQQDIVRGKPGYHLTVGDAEYTIEPQVELGPSDGVAVCSAPDFLIRPVRSSDTCLPIAVFLDGFEFHKDIITTDTRKRLAIVQSGRYWVWSLTWNDVDDAITGKEGTLHPLPPSGADANALKVAVALGVDGLLPKLVHSPFTQLLDWLRQPDAGRWGSAVFARALAWAFPGADTSDVAAVRTWLLGNLPFPMRESVECASPALAGVIRLIADRPAPDVRWVLPTSALKPPLGPDSMVLVSVLDQHRCETDSQRREAWRLLLATANLLQFLPCTCSVTLDGLAAGVYEQAGWQRLQPTAAVSPETEDPGWAVAVRLAVMEARAGLRELAGAGIPVPVVGHELQDASGAIIAEAEFAWLDSQVVVLRADQAEQRTVWEKGGWTVVVIAEGWEQAVIASIRGMSA